VDASELRTRFLNHFADRGHTIVPSASLIPHDPTLLFTIAGMVPFKPYFLGAEVAPYQRAASIQKCFRVPDIEQIGTTSRHLTFFEMLGNFSFGDYFKAGAIEYAWSLITEGFGMDPDRLWVTVHTSDDDAAQLWQEIAGVKAERIQRLDADNFWGMGDTGPCGPSSEIFFDLGSRYGDDGGPALGGEERFVEFWNLVFMQFNRDALGELSELPTKNIDTGSGFERVLALVNGQDSVFATDLFAPLLDSAQRIINRSLGDSDASDIVIRRIAEHGRAMTMLVADGVLPANEGRGYVLRRIIRRAILAARREGCERPITADLVAATIEKMGTAHPVLVKDRDLIESVLAREEAGFSRTLRAGLALLNDATTELTASSSFLLPGDVAFRLHDTHGFPIELTSEIVSEQGLQVDRVSFDAEMSEQRRRARAAAKKTVRGDDSSYREILDNFGPTEFVGRDSSRYSLEASVVALLQGDDGSAELFLDVTPFYAESGGQVGDTGTIVCQLGRMEVVDTQSVMGGLTVHRGTISGDIIPGQTVVATIDGDRREAIRRNHTATHLLHAALRHVLGDHVRQQGSLVDPDRLRFDFSHGEPISDAQRSAVLQMVNRDVVTNPDVDTIDATRQEAESMGAVAFFGDKYGDRVRVVQAGPNSLEFCGGTHVHHLGDIGQIQIVSEASIGANTRRIEAVTGLAALQRSEAMEQTLNEVASALKSSHDDVMSSLSRVLDRQRELEKSVAALRQSQLSALINEIHGTHTEDALVARVDGFSGDQLRHAAQELHLRGHSVVVLIGRTEEDKVALVAATNGSKDATALVKSLATHVNGGGGGSATLALAGGRNPDGIDAALDAARASVA
jgi:alanyl-tRNA synthetase